MKIVQINSSYTLANSTGRSTVEMHQGFMSRGIQSWVITFEADNTVQKGKNVFVLGYKVERKLHAGLSRLTGLQGYYSLFATRKILSLLDRIHPDAVVLRVLHSNSIDFPALTAYLAEKNIATVLVLHDCWYFTGHCCYYTEVHCDKWQKDCRGCVQIHDWNSSLFFDTAYKCLSDKQAWFSAIPRLGVVGVSDWITGEARKSILRNAREIRRIYNWIDQAVFKPRPRAETRQKLGLPANRPLLLGVASGWSDRKGLQEILKTAYTLPEAAFVLLGKCAVQELPANVVAKGEIRDPQILAQYYAAADIFLNPSVQETFGKTTAEALCCGTPVMAYQTTACTELVGQERGRLVPLGDRGAFVRAVKELLESEREKQEKACAEFAARNFDMQKNIEEYQHLFERLV